MLRLHPIHVFALVAITLSGCNLTERSSIRSGIVAGQASPGSGEFSELSRKGRVITVKVDTSDNVGVTKVELYVDGKLTSTSTTAPYDTQWNTRLASAGAHQLVTKAYDARGNVGTSQPITVYK